jgi:hypothetical protein
MKISFPKYGIDELLTQKRLATCIISFVALAVFAGVFGSYLLANKFWLLTIAMLGMAGILLFLGAAAAIFLKQSKVDEGPSAPIEETAPRLTPQWDYRPKKPVRASAIFDIPSTETSEALSRDPFAIDNKVWRNDDSPECATLAFVHALPGDEGPITNVPSQATEPACTAPRADDAAVSRYDQSPIDEQTAIAE